MADQEKGLEGINDLDEEIEKASGKDDAKNELEEQKKKIKKLESEKEDLASVIDEISSAPAANLPEKSPIQSQPVQNVQPMLDNVEKKFNDQIKAITGAISQLGEKVKSAEKGAGGDNVKKIVSKLQESTDEKIGSIESALKEMSEKLTAPPNIPTSGGEDVSKGLSAFGETMDFKDDLIEVKNSLRKLKSDLDEFKESSESKFIRLKDQTKEMSKLANMEERLDFLNEKFGAENIEKLNKLVLSANEISNNIIPKEITKKLDIQVMPLYNNVGKIKEVLASLNKKMSTTMNEVSKIKAGLKEIGKIKEDSSDKEKENKKIIETLNEKDTHIKDLIDEQKEFSKEMKKEFVEKIGKVREYVNKSMKEDVKNLFEVFSAARFNELEDKSTKNLIIAKEQVNEMVSKITKMENYVRPTIQLMDDQIGKMEERINDFEEERKNFTRDAEEVINYKFKENVDAKLNDMEKIFEKKTENNKDSIDSVESRISQLEDLANPSIKMFGNQLNKFETKIEKFNDSQLNVKEYLKDMKNDIEDLQGTVRSLLQMKDHVEKTSEKTTEIDDLKTVINEIKGDAVREKRDMITQINGINKGLDFLSGLGKDTNKNKKDIDDMNDKISKVNENMKMLKGQFDNVVTQSLLERKELMESSKRQKAQINEILKELKNI